MKLDWIDWRILRDLALILGAWLAVYGLIFAVATGRI